MTTKRNQRIAKITQQENLEDGKMVGVKNISEMMLKQGEIHVHHGNESGKTRTGKNSRRVNLKKLVDRTRNNGSNKITCMTMKQVDYISTRRSLEYVGRK